MPLLTSRLARFSGGCLAAGSLTLCGPAGSAWAGGAPPAAAETRATPADHSPRVIHVAMTNSGFTLPGSVHAGFVTFRATTSDPQGHALQGFQLHRGVNLADVSAEFKKAVSHNPVDAVAGIKALERDITAVGGPTVDPLSAVSDTIPLTRGTYYFFDFNDVHGPGSITYHKLSVHGRFDGDLPRHDGVIIETENKAGPRFVAPNHLNTDATFLVENHANELHEAVFQRVTPGMTDKKLQTVFDALAQGKQPPFNPFAEQTQRGVGAMSPGRIQLLHFDPKAGPYALLCFIPDAQSGIPHAFLGMHKIVRLR